MKGTKISAQVMLRIFTQSRMVKFMEDFSSLSWDFEVERKTCCSQRYLLRPRNHSHSVL